MPFLRLVRVLGACSLVIAVAACDSSESEDTGSSGASGSGMGGSAGAAGAAGGASTGKDECQNQTDLAWLKGTAEGTSQTGREFAREKAGDCGLGCLNSSTPDQCAIDCMIKEGVKLSNDCAGCYGGIVLCTINNCLPKCLDDPQAQICKDCQAEMGCEDAFFACTGPLD